MNQSPGQSSSQSMPQITRQIVSQLMRQIAGAFSSQSVRQILILAKNEPLSLIAIPAHYDPTLSEEPSHVSLLDKYIIFDRTVNGLNATVSSTNGSNLQKAINVETREHFWCKIMKRDVNACDVVKAYGRLRGDDPSNSVVANPVIVVSPKSIYLMFPVNFGNLYDCIIEHGKLSENLAARLFKQIVTAVQYCHEKGIVIKDMKLSNFVFSDNERTQVQLRSLEDAAVLTNLADDGLTDKGGCLDYFSPEKVATLGNDGMKYPGKASDIWGLGIILHFMIVGKYPFHDDNDAALIAAIRDKRVPMPVRGSFSMKCLMKSLLKKKPSRRPTCEQILSNPWVSNGGPLPRPIKEKPWSRATKYRYLRPSRAPCAQCKNCTHCSTHAEPDVKQNAEQMIAQNVGLDELVPDFDDDQMVPKFKKFKSS